MDNIVFLTKLVIGVAISVLLWITVESLMRIMKIHDHKQRSYLYFIAIFSTFSSIVYAFFFVGIHKNGNELIVTFPHSVLRVRNMMPRSVPTGEGFAFLDLRVIFFSLIIVSIFIFVCAVFLSAGYVKKRINLERCRNKKSTELIKRVCHENNVNPPKIMMVDGVNAFVFGFPPILALGRDLVDHVNENELKLIIQHEVNHIKNYDNILKPFLLSLRILFFFNPVVHILSRSLVREREFLADMVSEIKKEKVLFLYSLVRLSELHLLKNTMVPSIISFSLVKPSLKTRTETLLREHKRTGMRPYFVSLWIFSLLILAGMYVSSNIAIPGRPLPPDIPLHESEMVFGDFYPQDNLNADHHGIQPTGGDAESDPFRSQKNPSFFVPDPRAFARIPPGRFYCVSVKAAIAFILVIPFFLEGGYYGIRSCKGNSYGSS